MEISNLDLSKKPIREVVMDVGTGGGFPGIPLAILFPKTNFHLVDSIGKKLKVINGVADALDLKNIKKNVSYNQPERREQIEKSDHSKRSTYRKIFHQKPTSHRYLPFIHLFLDENRCKKTYFLG